MEKWADYGVFGVRFDENRCVVELEVRADLGDVFAESEWMSREAFVRAIDHNKSFVVVTCVGEQCVRGERVRAVMIRCRRYIRADLRCLRSDELGALPEYGSA